MPVVPPSMINVHRALNHWQPTPTTFPWRCVCFRNGQSFHSEGRIEIDHLTSAGLPFSREGALSLINRWNRQALNPRPDVPYYVYVLEAA
jgi:hypothetical protein